SSQRGTWILRGQGLDRAAQRPFQVLVDVVEGVRAAVALEPELASTLRQRLGDHGEAACAALPELAQVLGMEARAALGPEAFGETRSLQALAILLDALGTPERPALLLLDDGQ